jgi:hypothetical protein
MGFGGKKNVEPLPPVDGSAWIIDNGFAEFVLMHSAEIVSLAVTTHAGRVEIFHVTHSNIVAGRFL